MLKNWVSGLISGIMAYILLAMPAGAQDTTLRFVTVDRAPFSTPGPNGPEGFSIDLMKAIADELGRSVEFEFVSSFPEMLARVEAASVDGAMANISITAEREERLDFTQPIFGSGIKILLRGGITKLSLLRTIWTQDIMLTILAAFVLLVGGGFLMWVFERNHQSYFDRDARDAMFPSFWWAIHVVVNGGFEERMPQSLPGRIFGTCLVFASLFLVSVFVAQITASLTVEALQDRIDDLNDLDGRSVGTVASSTSADLLNARDLRFVAFDSPTRMFEAFKAGQLNALVFDAPILAYFAKSLEPEDVQLLDRIYRAENYGIALPTGSRLREPIDQSILRLREMGDYDALVTKWFGSTYSR